MSLSEYTTDELIHEVVTRQAAEAALAKEKAEAAKVDIFVQVIKAAAETWGCPPWLIPAPSSTSGYRTEPLASARLASYLFLRDGTDFSFPALGRAFGGRNHATIQKGCKQARDRLTSDREFSEKFNAMSDRLKSAGWSGKVSRLAGNS